MTLFHSHQACSASIATTVAAVLALTPCVAPAQATPPDAGQTARELMRAPPSLPKSGAPALRIEQAARGPTMAGGGSVRLAGVRISGNRTLATAELDTLLAGETGKEFDLAGLQGLAERITRHYRERGYLLARAYLPAQEMKDGMLDIAVLEGRYGAVTLANTSGVADDVLHGPLAALQAGEVVAVESLGRSLLLLGDLPGVEVKSTLKPGAALGTSDLLVEVAPGRRLAGSAELDNYGNRYTGEYRLGGGLEFNNPLDRGDQLSLRGLSSDEGLTLARLAYQAPLGASGLRAGLAHSDMRYALAKDFATLRASGTSTVDSLYAQYPLLRRRDANANLQAQFDRKKLEDRVGATASVTAKQLDVATIALAGDFQDGWGGGGINTFNLALTAGQLDIASATALAIDQATARAAGGYAKFSLNLARMQRLGDGLGLLAGLQAQWADGNLDSAEKLGLGGNQGVRAYPQGEASGDAGWLLNLELRRQLAPGWLGGAFVDAGRVSINRDPWVAGSNVRELTAYGLTAQWSEAADWSAKAVVAWHGSQRPTSDIDRTPRVWFQIARRF